MTVFIIGLLLTLINSHGILLARVRFIPLHVIGVLTGAMLMAQETVKQL